MSFVQPTLEDSGKLLESGTSIFGDIKQKVFELGLAGIIRETQAFNDLKLGVLFNNCRLSSGIAAVTWEGVALVLLFLDVVGKVAEGLQEVSTQNGKLLSQLARELPARPCAARAAFAFVHRQS